MTLPLILLFAAGNLPDAGAQNRLEQPGKRVERKLDKKVNKL